MDAKINLPGESWFFEYKIYHLPFWFAYHVMWWTITIGDFGDVAHNIIYSAYSVKFLFYVVFQAFGVYFNLYFLMPRYLYTGRYVAYLGFFLSTVLICAAFIVCGYYFSAYLSALTFKELYGRELSDYKFFFAINTLPSTVGSMTLAMSIKLTKNWIQSQKKQQDLEREKLETELKFLKSQFHPHFLFNTINSIFVLIHKNPDLASESLATFSDLMRYQLYECNENEIQLSRELSFLDDFIQLEKLRIDEQHTRLSYELNDQSAAGQTIAPFILMPFMENAFKHVSKGKDQQNRIEIEVKIDENSLDLIVGNSISTQRNYSNEAYESRGIGLKNVQRRLDLHYGKNYQLHISESEDYFKVHLSLYFQHKKTEEFAYQYNP